jgi:2-iminobutanoate/2-iminopropanoate deaminase
VRILDPRGLAPPDGGYSHGVVATGELLFISGQTPEGLDGTVSSAPDEQFRQIWSNIEAVLQSAGAGLGDLVQVRTYLASREHTGVNSEVRQAVLGGHKPALTVIICELFEPAWVGEIEAIAALPAANRGLAG